MSKGIRYSDEVRSRAIRMVQEHQQEYESEWAAINSITPKIGCSAEALRGWIRRQERDSAPGPGRPRQTSIGDGRSQ